MRNLATLEFSLLVAFEALLSERSVSRAADRLAIAQPTMSGMLARLRLMFEDELFVRTSKGMVPTTRALELAAPVNAALDRIRFVLKQPDEKFEPRTAEHLFTIGAIDYITFTLLGPLVQRFRQEAPFARLFVRMCKGANVATLLDEHRIDVALGTLSDVPKRIAIRGPLFTDRLVCIAARQHPALRGGLPLDIFLTQPHARRSHSDDRLVDYELARSGYTRPIMMVLPNWHAVGIAVVASDLLAIIPESAARALALHLDLSIHDLPIDLEPKNVNIAWSRDRGSDTSIVWLCNLVADSFAANASVAPPLSQ
jgi:DNA-binding transcriptional LysR family regulator